MQINSIRDSTASHWKTSSQFALTDVPFFIGVSPLDHQWKNSTVVRFFDVKKMCVTNNDIVAMPQPAEMTSASAYGTTEKSWLFHHEMITSSESQPLVAVMTVA